MWTYIQASGKLLDPTDKQEAKGYSGHGDGVNNPAMQEDADVGPIPCGQYTIGKAQDTTTHGPCVLSLTPLPGTNDFGRSGFLIHGDEVAHVGQELASLGCIIMPRAVRNLISASTDKTLLVISGTKGAT